MTGHGLVTVTGPDPMTVTDHGHVPVTGHGPVTVTGHGPLAVSHRSLLLPRVLFPAPFAPPHLHIPRESSVLRP